MLIKLRLQCIGNVCCVLVYSQSVYSTQLCVHTEQWIHNFGLINEEFTLCIWNSMLIKLRLKCIGNACCVLVYSQSVYSTQLCVHTEQWIHNFGLINEEFTLRIWNSMLIKLRLQCIGNVCCVLVYSQSVYSTQLCVHTEQWIHNVGLTPVLAQRVAVWSIPK